MKVSYNEHSPSLSRIMVRVLDRSKHIDYVIAFALGALPIGLWAIMLLLGTNIRYMDAWNFTTLAVILPGLLWLLRWAMGKIAPVLEPWPPSDVPPILELLHTESGRKTVYTELRSWILSPKIVWVTVLVAIVVQVLDMRKLLVEQYIHQYDPAKMDWTTIFLAGEISWQANLAFVFVAYSVQFAVVLVSFCMGFLLLTHNCFFLSRIYQRRRVPDGQEENYFEIDLADGDRCFGFRKANSAFNTQILLLMAGGVFMLVTRFVNAPTWKELVEDPNSILPTVGQTIIALGWLLGFLVVSMPMLVKLLPRLPIGGSARASRTITSYLREFVSPDRWPFGFEPTREEIQALAARFASHAFWPTGNNRASQLFFVAIWIGLIVFFTPPTDIRLYLVSSLLLMGVFAYFGRYLIFKLLNSSLNYVDSRLVDLPQGDPPDLRLPGNKLETGVFISYRRADSAAYTGRLYDYLTDHFHRDRIFIDLDDISVGEKFPEVLDKALTTSSAMIVMIGPNWASSKDQHGKPRLMNADDWVRRELATALRRNIRVVPVLVGRAQMPSADDLPEDLAALLERHAHEISDKRWDHDAKLLMDALRDALDSKGPNLPNLS